MATPPASATDAPSLKLTLERAIQQALASNFSVRIQSFNDLIAKAGVTEALGKFDPSLTASYTAGTEESPNLISASTGLRSAATLYKTESYDFGLKGLLPWGMTYKIGASADNERYTSNLFANEYTTFGGISATQPLLRDFGFGPTLYTIRVAQNNRRITEWEFKQEVIDVVTEVIRAYHELDFAIANLKSARRARELAQQLLTENEKRVAVGSMSEFDVISARSRLASREESILTAERQVREDENALKQLITAEHTPALLTLSVEIAAPPPAPVVVADAAADFQIALKQRPDYQQALLNAERRDLGVRYQRNQMLPSVDLVGSYGYNGYDRDFRTARSQVRSEDYHVYSAGVTVSVPLTFTTERGRYRAAQLELRRAEATLQQLEQSIVVLVGNAAGQIVTTQKRVESARRARELAQYTLDAEVKRLRAGSSSTYYVLQQQESLSTQEIAEYRAQADYQKAIAEYDRQLGATLVKQNIKIDPPQ